ncbi:MAG: hypothetical protein D6732_01075 [Methanobacteriota archaeon]|nr:MAG: hypothetical protein D6732_01075 [Euryarchaeota archaeon]
MIAKYLSLPVYIPIITSTEMKQTILDLLSKMSMDWADISVKRSKEGNPTDEFVLVAPLPKDSPKQGYKIRGQFVVIYIGFFPKKPIYEGNTPLKSDVWFNAYLILDDGNIGNIPEWVSFIHSIQQDRLERNSVNGVPPFLNYAVGKPPAKGQKGIKSMTSRELEKILKELHLKILNA